MWPVENMLIDIHYLCLHYMLCNKTVKFNIFQMKRTEHNLATKGTKHQDQSLNMIVLIQISQTRVVQTLYRASH